MARRKGTEMGGASDGTKITRKRTKDPPPPHQRITRAMTGRSISMAVFDTAELLERILLNVDWKQLFVLQRVCTQFRDILASSPRLQERCWLRRPKDLSRGEIQGWTPSKALGGWAVADVDVPEDCKALPVRLSPAFQTTSPLPLIHWLPDQFPSRSLNHARLNGNVKISFEYGGPHQSMLDTYICHPPCKVMKIFRMEGAFATKPKIKVFFIGSDFPGDVTLGEMFEQFRAARKWIGYGKIHRERRKAKSFPNMPFPATLQEIATALEIDSNCEIAFSTLYGSTIGVIVPTETEWETMAAMGKIARTKK